MIRGEPPLAHPTVIRPCTGDAAIHDMRHHMNEALRLTLAGNPFEATATIRRALAAGGLVPATAPGDGAVSGSPSSALLPSARVSAPPIPGLMSFHGDGGGLRGSARSSGGAGSGLMEARPSAGRFVSCSYSDAAGSRAYKLYIPIPFT